MKNPKHQSSNSRSQSEDTEFSFGSGNTYADKDEYVTKSLAFDILKIVFESGKGYDGNDRWALTAKCADREPEILTLGSNAKRDEQLREAQAYLKRGGSLKNVRLRQSGNAYYLADGTR